MECSSLRDRAGLELLESHHISRPPDRPMGLPAGEPGTQRRSFRRQSAPSRRDRARGRQSAIIDRGRSGKPLLFRRIALPCASLRFYYNSAKVIATVAPAGKALGGVNYEESGFRFLDPFRHRRVGYWRSNLSLTDFRAEHAESQSSMRGEHP